MHCQTSSCDTARLAPGQSLHIAVDAGTAFVVTAGRLRIDEAPRWIADVCVPVGCTLDEGAHHVVERAGSAKAVRTLVARKGPGLIFATIQKYRMDESVPDALSFEVLNEDSSILVVVDEAHRTQAGDLHANLLAALPNCARIGFTGTPIIMGEKKRTGQIFGSFIDRYTIKEAEADGATVPVLYEGRTAEGATGASGMVRFSGWAMRPTCMS